MDLDTLKIFYRAAQAGSFAHSGVRLSPSAIGRQISLLEQELGVSLFFRKRNGVELTSAGLYFLDHVESILSQIDTAKQALKENATPPTAFRLITPTVWASGFLIPSLMEYQQLHENSSITLIGQDELMRPSALELTMQVFPYKDPNKQSANFLVGKTKLKLFAHKSYVKRTSKPKSLSDLKNHVLIAHTNRLYPFVNFDWFFDRAKEENHPIVPSLSTNNVIPFLISGFGIATLVENHPLVVSGELIDVLPDEHGPEVQVFLIVHKIQEHHRQVVEFRKILEQRMGGRNI